MKKIYRSIAVIIMYCFTFGMPAKAYDSLTIKLGEYKSIHLEVPKMSITDSEFQEAIYEELLPYATEKRVLDRSINPNDIVEITYSINQGSDDYKDYEKINDYICIGSGNFDRYVEVALVNHKIGDIVEISTTKLDFENGFYNCIQLQYTIYINNIFYYEIPEITDDFVRRNFGLNSVDEFYSFVRKEEIIRKRNVIEEDLKNVLIRIIMANTAFDYDINKRIEARYDDVIEQYSKMASLYDCDIGSIMDTYDVSEYDIWKCAEQQEKTFEICQSIFLEQNMEISSEQKRIIENQIMDEYYYENIEDYINDVGQDAYEERILINYVLEKLYIDAIARGRKDNVKKENRNNTPTRYSY